MNRYYVLRIAYSVLVNFTLRNTQYAIRFVTGNMDFRVSMILKE